MTNLNLANLGIAAIVISDIDNNDVLVRLRNSDFTNAVWDNKDELVDHLNDLLDDGDVSFTIYSGNDFSFFAADLNNGGFDLDQGDFILFTRILN